MNGLEDGALLAKIRPGHQTQPAHEARAKVGNDAPVKVLSIFAHHDQVELRKGSAYAGHCSNRTKIGIEIEGLAQRHIDTLMPAPDGRRQRTLQRHPVPLDRLYDGVSP